MPASVTRDNPIPEEPPARRSKRNLRDLLHRGLYAILTIAVIGAVIYFFVALRANQRRVSNLYLSRAKAFMRQDEVDKAADALKKAGLADPGSREVQMERLKTEIFQIANQSDSLARQLDLERLNQAETDCKRLLSQEPGSAELTALLGILYAHQDQPMLAMETYKKAMELAPNYPNVRNYWGYSAYQWHYPENWEQVAAQKFNEAKELDSKYVSPRINLALLELNKKNFEGAISIFTDVEKIQSNNEILYTVWGVTLDEWGRTLQTASRVEAYEKFAEALEKYRRAEALNPKLALIHFDKANALSDGSERKVLNGTDEAISEYKKVLELEPTLAYAHIGIAELLIDRQDSQQKDIEEAVGHLNQAIRLTQQTIDQYQLRKTKTTDAHALKTLDRWTNQRQQEIAAFKDTLKTAEDKLAGNVRSAKPPNGKGK